MVAQAGAPGRRFDASRKRLPVTELSYINRLANRPHRSAVKALPATLPEPLAVSRGQRLEVQASRLPPRGRRTGVTGAGCWIWSELGRDVGRIFGVLAARSLGGRLIGGGKDV